MPTINVSFKPDDLVGLSGQCVVILREVAGVAQTAADLRAGGGTYITWAVSSLLQHITFSYDTNYYLYVSSSLPLLGQSMTVGSTSTSTISTASLYSYDGGRFTEGASNDQPQYYVIENRDPTMSTGYFGIAQFATVNGVASLRASPINVLRVLPGQKASFLDTSCFAVLLSTVDQGGVVVGATIYNFTMPESGSISLSYRATTGSFSQD